ncbi:hypothetical protein ACC46_08865, partial [Francisella tularensis subsp. holarctica]
GTILLGLGAIKGLGGEAIKSILTERAKLSSYISLCKYTFDSITVLAPNVNKSVYDCIAVSKGTILL